MKSIKNWQKAAYKLAVEKGWHHRECPNCYGDKHVLQVAACMICNGTGRVPVDPHSPTRIASRLERIHSEISEAGECVARGRMELYFVDPATGTRCAPNREGAKPEGFPVELADVFLRLCDLAESLGVEIPELGTSVKLSDCEMPEEIAAELGYLHKLAVRIGTNPFNALNYGALYTQLHFLMAWTSPGIDLLAMAELKHEFNKTRPIRHGGKVL